MRRIATFLSVLVVSAATLAGGGAAQAAGPRPVTPPLAPAGFFGVNADGPVFDDPAVSADVEFGRMRTTGILRVRAVLDWSYGQPTGPDSFDPARSDALIGGAARRGVSVLPVVQHAPMWATGGADRGYGTPPDDPATYAAFLTRLVQRYGPAGSFWAENPGIPRHPVRAWQVWNEPNIPQFWTGPAFPGPYVRLLKQAYAAVKAADPRAQVYLAGLSSSGEVDGVATPAWTALEQLYAAGAAGAFDVLAVHPYTATAANLTEILRRVRAVARRHGGARLPMAVTEMSWSSGGGTRPGVTWDGSEDSQAALLKAAFRELARRRLGMHLVGAYWYSWLSPAAPPSWSWDSFAGLNRMQDGRVQAKPALEAMRMSIRRLSVR